MKKLLTILVFLTALLNTSYAAQDVFIKDDVKYICADYAKKFWDADIIYYSNSKIIEISKDSNIFYLQLGDNGYRKNIYINPFFIDSSVIKINGKNLMPGKPFFEENELFIPIEFFHNNFYEKNTYDVIVVGGDPEGISAAVSASRRGAKTLILSDEPGWGGLLTYGMLNTLDMNYNKNGELLTKGIFEEFYEEIDRTESFDVERVKKIFWKMLDQEKSIDYRIKYKFSDVIIEDNTIKGILALNETGEIETFYGFRVIDATQDGDVCAKSNVPFYFGMEDINVKEHMAATLVFKVNGVDWNKLSEDINRYKTETQDLNCGINESSAWGFGKWCYDNYNSKYYNMKLRGPNIGLQEDGSVLINALQIFNVDVSNKKSIEEAKEFGKNEAVQIVEYLRKILSSFENATFAGAADELYIRETRHIQGEYTLKATDLLEGTNFDDKIAMGSYSVDIQSTSMDNNGYVIFVPNQYFIPLRCIIPKTIDNLFIVGKSASYSSVAAGSARVVPVGMVTGESAGIIAMFSIMNNIKPREIIGNYEYTSEMTELLIKQGIYLSENTYADPVTNETGYEKFKELINLGIVAGGYSNDFGLNNDATNANATYGLIRLLERRGNNLSEEFKNKIYSLSSQEKATITMMGRILLTVLGETENSLTDRDILNFIKEKKYFETYNLDEIENLTVKDVYLMSIEIADRYINFNKDILTN